MAVQANVMVAILDHNDAAQDAAASYVASAWIGLKVHYPNSAEDAYTYMNATENPVGGQGGR
jgi:hypothetical protein